MSEVVEGPPLAQDEAEIFEEGAYPQGTYSAADLEQIAASYKPAIHDAPSITDHSEEGAIRLGQRFRGPAYGWVQGVRTIAVKKSDGSQATRLVAKFGDVSEEFRTMVREGRVRYPSAEFYKGFPATGQRYLAAVAWLGAQTPQVKGLRRAHFAQAGEGVETEVAEQAFDGRHAFAEPAPGKGATEDTMAEITQDQMNAAIKTATDAVSAQMTEHFSEAFAQREGEIEAKLATQSATLKAATDEAAALKADLAKERARGRRAEFVRFAEVEVASNRMAPAVKDKVVDLMLALDGRNVGEGDSAKPATDLFREVYAAAGPRVPLGEHAAFRGGAPHETLRLKAADGKTTVPLVIPAGADPATVRFAEQAARMENAESFEAALIATSIANPDAYRN